MSQKVVRRTLKARHSPRPQQRGRLAAAPAGGFASMLARLDGASAQLQRARPRGSRA